ncbi:hypothetical protein PVK06_001959 [Gossypium arboreum]|uniref:DUF4218 domain-containing protein n=1 Tax=Gossypium arboreum TaxID=29729 RepID=A0ABR0R2D1_GOSAR|nr:hypothetical protein PVK06_001959 [Gossypium arboreum]
MSKKEKEVFCMVLKDIKVPDAYVSNISRCVSLKNQRLYSLKSHYYHILMQDLLPIALRCCMSKNVMSCIIELSNIMKTICGKVLDVEELKKVQDQAALTLCNLEKIFPPSFFTIMVHLVFHLPHEEILGGPVSYRWMYPIERFLRKLKSYCRNKRYPEGSIAEGYLAEECMTFCSRYLEDVETRLNRPTRNVGLNDHNLAETYLFQSYGESVDKVEIAELDDISWIQAHRYVLFHYDLVEPLRNGKDVNDEVKWLSQGPDRVIKRYSAFLINGYGFHTKYRERMRRTQNCGVIVNSSITSYASARDSNLIEGNVEYCGLLTDIIELDYYGRWKVVLFRCDWADVNTARGIKKDEFGKMRRKRLRDLSIVQNTPNSEEGNSEQQTVVGSSNVSETLDEPEEFQTESGGTRRVRGRTFLRDLYDLDPVERVKVNRNTHGQPVGSEARLLAGYLGILGRNANMLPINYESWHHMPDSNKNQALANIKERFALEVSNDYIKKALGKKWRDNKSTFKKQYFQKDISLEEKLRNVLPGMLMYQWEDAVRFWNSKKGEDRERVGTSSRQKQKFTHPAGSRSFASVAEAEEVKSGQKIGRLQLFEITHRKKDGSPMTSEAGEIMEKLKEKKTEYEAIASTDSYVNLENIDNRIITKVLGPERYSRVRFQGSGVTPTQYFGSGSQQYMPSRSQAQAEVQRLTDQMAQIAEAAEREAAAPTREAATAAREAEARVRETKAAAMAAEKSKKYDDLQLQLQQMMQMFQQSQKPPS